MRRDSTKRKKKVEETKPLKSALRQNSGCRVEDTRVLMFGEQLEAYDDACELP